MKELKEVSSVKELIELIEEEARKRVKGLEKGKARGRPDNSMGNQNEDRSGNI